jgi:hypothetical protein
MAQNEQPGIIELTKSGPVLSGPLSILRDRFAAQHCVVLKNLLAPQLLEEAQRTIERGDWQNGDEYAAGTGLVLTSNDRSAPTALHFLMNHPEFLKVIGVVTGCEAISEFRLGAIYRMRSADQHEISWHDDLNDKEKRQVALSLNLSSAVFRGGAFELRERRTKKVIAQVNNTGPGDALLFRVSSDLEHRVAPLEEGEPKTAFTGWFCATGETHLSRLVNRLGSAAP